MMEKKLKTFLDDAFKPYGNFPSRDDVEQELLANLTDKYQDLKAQGKSDEEAYQATVDSFGDVAEFMGDAQAAAPYEDDTDGNSVGKILRGQFKLAKKSKSRFSWSELRESDLSDTNLAGEDFSTSSIEKSNFDRANLAGATFRGSSLNKSTFNGANLAGALFAGSDLTKSSFDGADLTNATFKASSLSGSSFKDTNVTNTRFSHSDLGGVSFEGRTLIGTDFGGTGLKNTSFKDAVLENVSFKHADVRRAIFDGTTMDKITYAILKGGKANLDTVIIK